MNCSSTSASACSARTGSITSTVTLTVACCTRSVALTRISFPSTDYERLDDAVERTYRDVFGRRDDADALRELLVSRQHSGPVLPRGQAALFALRDLGENIADAVLERVRHHYGAPKSLPHL